MKRYVSTVLVLVLALTFSACGASTTPTGPEPVAPNPVSTVISVAVSGKEFDFRTTALEVGKSAQATATATYSDASTKDVTSEAVWSSSDESVVKVNNGAIAAMSPGTARISARMGQAQDAMDITVREAGPAVVSLAVTARDFNHRTMALEVGRTVQGMATATLADSSTRDIASEAVWSSRDTAITTVSPTGLVTAVSPGQVGILASYGGRRGEMTLTVQAAGVASLTVKGRDFDHMTQSLEIRSHVTRDARSATAWTSATAWN